MSRNSLFSAIAIPLLLGFSLNASANEPIRAGTGTLGLSVGATAPSDTLGLNSIAIRYRVNHRFTLEPMFKYTMAKVDDTSSYEEFTFDEDGVTSTISDIDRTSLPVVKFNTALSTNGRIVSAISFITIDCVTILFPERSTRAAREYSIPVETPSHFC